MVPPDSTYDNLQFIKSLKELTTSIDEGIIITDESENIIWVNKAFEEICGSTLEDLKGKKPNTLQGHATDKNTVKEIRDALAKGNSSDSEILNYRPDKTPYWIKLNISPIKNDKGVLTNFVAFEHDITHEKNIETDLTESEKQYKDLFEKNPCVMWICDIADFRFVEVNQAAIDKYSYSREEFMKMTLKDIKPSEEHRMLNHTFTSLTETYKDRGIWKHLKKNGEIIFVEVKTSRIKYDGKDCSLALLNDVTDKVKKEMEVEELNSQLELRIIESEKNNKALAKANQRFEYVSKAANEAIWDLDLETNIISFAGSYKEMFGYSYPNDEISISKIKHLVHPDDIERVNKSIADALSDFTRRYWENYYRVINQDGSIVFVHDRAYVIYNERTDKPVRFVGVIQNITQEKKNEEAILEQMKKTNIIIQSITDIFYVVDVNYDLLYTNEAMEKLISLSKDELIGKNIWKIFENVGISFPKEKFEKALREKTASEFEMEYQGKTFQVYFHPSELGLAVLWKDITELKKREEEIINNTKFIKEISDSTSGFIFQLELTPDFTIKLNYASEKAEEYWGISVKDAIENKAMVLDSIHPEDAELVKTTLLEIVKNLSGLSIKYRYVNKQTKEIKWVNAAAVPTRLENGNTIVNGIVINISEMEKSYLLLEEANRRYEYLSRATGETIWDRDVLTNVITLGGGYKEMLGMMAGENTITFDKWKSLIHSDDKQKTLACIDKALSNNGEKFWECEYRLIKNDGVAVDVFEKAYILYDKKTNIPVKIIGSTRDITELKKIQEEKDNLLQDLLRRNKALEQFTFMVSHNLRAPIANMMGIIDLIDDESLDGEVKKDMHDLNRKSVIRLNDVVRDMNEILNVKKNIDEDRTEVFFDIVLEEIKDVLFSIIKNTKIEFKSDFRKARSFFTIKSYIYSIFQNLITNSIKYRQDGSSLIKVSSDEDAEFVYLTFEDDGLGIDMEKNKDKVFGLYNRFDLTKDGKGMGLFMVKSQVEDLEGEINIESEINVGTKFFIKLKK